MFKKKPNEYIAELKNNMAEMAANEKLESLFLIGSCANDKPSEDWYQDYDVHFLSDEIYISSEKLDWLRGLLENLSNRVGNNECKIEWFVKDRHWKMVPQNSYPINIGIHGTLLNSADHFRRVHYNPILASNMFGRCQVLHGKHPGVIRGSRIPSTFEYFHSVGGIGWLAENFSRVVMLYQLDSNDHTFYPFIAGYCWNIASSIMFHIFTLNQNGLSGRKNAFQSFLEINDVRSNQVILDAALLLQENRRSVRDDVDFAKKLINAVGIIIGYAKKVFMDSLPTNFNLEKQKLNENDFYSDILRKLINKNDKCKVIDIFRDENLEYYDSIAKSLEEVKRSFGDNISPKENFEFVREIINRSEIYNKVRIWDSLSCFRLQYSHDYNLTNNVNSKESIIFGWEDGLQTILQRLNEVYIEKAGKLDDEFQQLIDFSEFLIDERVNLILPGMNIQKGRSNFDNTRKKISRILELFCHTPIIAKS